MFALQTADGNLMRFDNESNSKVMEALKNSDKKVGAIKVAANGTAKDGTLTIAALEIH